MAKKYIVTTTIQGRDNGGKKVVIPRSPEPQDIPSGLVKELLARGVIEEPKGLSTAKKPAQGTGGGDDDDDDKGGGDDASGD